MARIRPTLAVVAAVCLSLVSTGCSPGPAASTRTDPPVTYERDPNQGAGTPRRPDPVDFTTRVDNPYWPMSPGTSWRYAQTPSPDGLRTVDVSVTDKTRRVDGVGTRVVREVVRQGDVLEETYGWYAQDSTGNLWCFGEDSTQYSGGKPVGHAGSWQAGLDGAVSAVVVPADPRAGMRFPEAGAAADVPTGVRVRSVRESARVPAGSFDQLLLLEETAAGQPRVRERKYFAKGVGLVLAQGVPDEAPREALVEVTRAVPPPDAVRA